MDWSEKELQKRDKIDYQRIWVGISLALILYLLVRHLSLYGFFVFAAGGIMIVQYEFYRFYFQQRMIPSILFGLLLGFVVAYSFFNKRFFFDKEIITELIFIVIICHLFWVGDIRTNLTDIAVVFLGIIYISWLLSYLILLRNLLNGRMFLFFLFLVIWMGDTAAYYIGRHFGRHKLSPRISPNKTIEGAIGGLMASLAIAFISRLWFLPILSLKDCLYLGIILSLLGQIGDLSESMFKRSSGVKDSSNLIPGHGGLLDRIDSLIFTAPFLYYYVIFFIEKEKFITI
ncbi:MAG: phosphatidate cytidylyltransferase [Nitrospirota bacterium]